MTILCIRSSLVLVAGNWKMFKGPAETVAFFQAFEPPADVEIVVCPPFTSLAAAVGRGTDVYAQNVHWAEEGAFTVHDAESPATVYAASLAVFEPA